MADDWIKFWGSLRGGFWYGVPRSTRFILMELSHEAKALGGLIELPFGTKEHVRGLVEILGGNRREATAAIRFLARTVPPTLHFSSSSDRLTVEIPGWAVRNSTTKSTDRVRRHRAKRAITEASGENETPGNKTGNGVRERREREESGNSVSRNASGQLSLGAQNDEEPPPKKKKRKRRRDRLDGETPVQLGWKAWRSMYEEAYRAPYTDGAPDGRTMMSIAKAADRHAKAHEDHDPADLLATSEHIDRVLRHWFACYLEADGFKGCVAEARHPLRMLERDLPKYGLPWGRGALETPSRDVARETSPDTGRAAGVDERAKRVRAQMDAGDAPDLDDVLAGVGGGG